MAINRIMVIMANPSLDKQIQDAQENLRTIEDSSGNGQTDMQIWWSPQNAMTISLLVLLFGVFTLSLASYLIKAGKSPESILRTYGTILIIVVSVFLVVAGYSSNQIAPVIGLMGTLAGYLLGKGDKENNRGED